MGLKRSQRTAEEQQAWEAEVARKGALEFATRHLRYVDAQLELKSLTRGDIRWLRMKKTLYQTAIQGLTKRRKGDDD